jgi:hypothetical protein
MKIRLKIASLPKEYHHSQLYRDVSVKGEICIPLSRYTSTFKTKDMSTLKKNMKIIHFWAFDEIPDEIYTYVLACEEKGKLNQKINHWEWFVLGKKEMLFLCEHTTDRLCFQCAQHGFLSLLRYLLRHGYKCNEQTCSVAAQSGHIDCLMELHQAGCPWNEWTCIRAAEKGHLDCLQFAIEHGCPPSKEICAYAAENGHLSILEYALSISLPWDEVTMFQTADNGSLELMTWCHQQGCPVDERTTLYAVEKNHVDCLTYALEHQFPVNYNQCLRVAKRKRHDMCVEKIESHMKEKNIRIKRSFIIQQPIQLKQKPRF